MIKIRWPEDYSDGENRRVTDRVLEVLRAKKPDDMKGIYLRFITKYDDGRIEYEYAWCKEHFAIMFMAGYKSADAITWSTGVIPAPKHRKQKAK